MLFLGINLLVLLTENARVCLTIIFFSWVFPFCKIVTVKLRIFFILYFLLPFFEERNIEIVKLMKHMYGKSSTIYVFYRNNFRVLSIFQAIWKFTTHLLAAFPIVFRVLYMPLSNSLKPVSHSRIRSRINNLHEHFHSYINSSHSVFLLRFQLSVSSNIFLSPFSYSPHLVSRKLVPSCQGWRL